jgi:murein DD-endopeptidase MepM/ murein hydrolase activator NlpD
LIQVCKTNFFRTLSTLILALACQQSYAATAVPGGVYAWKLPPDASNVQFRNQPVLQVSGAALVGLPMSLKPGTYSLTYEQAGRSQTHEFDVADKQYSEQHITIENKAMVNPPAATLARIRAESARQRKLYQSFSAPVDLQKGFKLPLQGVTTSLFGHRRFFNGEPRNPHSGLDIAAETGTPIQAAGDGRVVLADELYFNGNTLFVDHGQGLITMYCHMSELLAQPGDRVEQGQTIGLVGATGRVTGPHLHWSVSLNGTRVDPTVFMQVLNAQSGGAAATSSSGDE